MFLGTELFWTLKQSKWQLFSKTDIFLITSISSPYTKVVHKSRLLFQFGRGSYCCQCFCFSSGPNSDVVAPGSSCTSIFDSCSKCCLACDTKFKVCFNGHKKKVHIQIIQDETDGPVGNLQLGTKDFHLTNNGWLAASLAVSVILWWQPKESSLAWPVTASEESHVQYGPCFLAPWKEQVIELQPL